MKENYMVCNCKQVTYFDVENALHECKTFSDVEKTFEGSLPAFIAAFTKHQKLTGKEIDEVQKMIDRFRKGE